MIRILHVVSSMNPVLGGVCKAVETIAVSLLANGIDNEVVSLDNSDSGFVIESPFKIHAFGSANNPWGYNSKLLPWLKDNIPNYNYVIVHGLWLYSSYAVNKAFKGKESKGSETPKYFVMPHGMLDPYFQQATGRRLKAYRNTIYWKLIEKKVVNQSSGLLFTCEEEVVLAKKPFKPYHPKNELIVGLGVEAPPSYKPNMNQAFLESCKGFNGRKYLLFLSRIHEKKGVDILLDAYKKIADKSAVLNSNKYKNDNKELPALIIAGPGLDSAYGKMILNKVSTNNLLKDNVYFPGMLSGDSKWGAFYNCDAFILPSHQENFGIAIVEALACSKPVLISNKINIWKEINDSSAGFVEDDTCSGTLRILDKWLLLSEEDKKTMGQHAKSCYRQNFALDTVVNNWQNKVLNM